MKKVFVLLALLCCTLSGFAEKKSIKLEREKHPHERSEIQLPTASIDGQVLTISFVSSTAFEVAVMDTSCTLVYMGAYSAQDAVITLPNLSDGEYQLEIEQGDNIYSGEFEIE